MNVRTWRLIESGFGSAARNMGVDEAIMRAVASGEQPPTLRLYGWRPPGLSLGYFQPLDAGIDVAESRRRGYDLVRRPTGGRAILHDDEVTYSFCIRQEEIRGGHSVMESYRQISRGIIAGLARLGAEVSMGDDRERRPHRRQRPGAQGSRGAAEGAVLEPRTVLPHSSNSDHATRTICFARTARCDLQAAGRKIVGSAQVRREGAILQHGSVPITIDPEAHAAVMPGMGDVSVAARRLERAAQGVAQLLGRPVSFEELSAALATGFAEAFAVTLSPQPLSPEEAAMAQYLQAEKYAADAWTEHAPSARQAAPDPT